MIGCCSIRSKLATPYAAVDVSSKHAPQRLINLQKVRPHLVVAQRALAVACPPPRLPELGRQRAAPHLVGVRLGRNPEVRQRANQLHQPAAASMDNRAKAQVAALPAAIPLTARHTPE